MLSELQPPMVRAVQAQPRKLAEACGTPMSQVSTAPPTPFQTWSLPDSELLDMKFSRMCTAESTALGSEDAVKFSRMYSVESSALGLEAVSSTDEEGVSDSEGENFFREPVVCAGMPVLQSKLGKRAQKLVEAQAFMERELSSARRMQPVVSAGMPVLESALGKRAQKLVEAQEFMERELSSERLMDSDVECDSSDDMWEDDDVEPVVSAGMPPLESELGQRAQKLVEAQDFMERALASELLADDCSTHGEEEAMGFSDGEYDSSDEMHEDGLVLSVGMPALQSELGKRAQRLLEAQAFMESLLPSDLLADVDTSDELHEDDIVDDREHVVCAGMPALTSELGMWAQRVATAQEWLEDRQSTEYLVDDSELQVFDHSIGVAWRFSKDANDRDCWNEGPRWGDVVTGMDQGDGWVKVGRRFLPMVLDGKQVLAPAAA